jgi:hypothetical protein
MMCRNCFRTFHPDSTSGKKLPYMYSIAAGCDEGWWRRAAASDACKFSCQEISMPLQYLLSGWRQYSANIKFVGKDDRTFCGHTAFIEQDGPDIVAKHRYDQRKKQVPDLQGARESIGVTFVGAEGLWPRKKEEAAKSPHLYVNATMLYDWFDLLAGINSPSMRGVEVMDSDELQAEVDAFSEQLVLNADVITDKKAVNADVLASSDVAQVRSDGPGFSVLVQPEEDDDEPLNSLGTSSLLLNLGHVSVEASQQGKLEKIRDVLIQSAQSEDAQENVEGV